MSRVLGHPDWEGTGCKVDPHLKKDIEILDTLSKDGFEHPVVWGHDNFPKEHFKVCWKIEENVEIVTISIKVWEEEGLLVTVNMKIKYPDNEQ